MLIDQMEFPHKAPKNYSYEVVDFKRNILSIWILNHSKFSYTSDSPVKSIWGFYNTKTKQYHSPVNAKTVGEVVDIDKTTPYSAMIIKHNPLMSCFV